MQLCCFNGMLVQYCTEFMQQEMALEVYYLKVTFNYGHY